MKGSENSVSIFSVTISFLFLFRDVFADPGRHLCHPDQRDAILEFMNKFQTPKPCFDRPLKSWADKSDCCSWDGIRCDAVLGDVIKLNLSESCLHGQFNSNSAIFLLQRLPFLTTLDLSANDFSGNIPSSLGNLSKLTTLDLGDNDFSGEIPSSLGNLSKLTFLNLSQNKLSGKIPYSLGNLLNITVLFLCANNFVGEVPSSFGNLSHLTFLALCENELSGEIPSSFGNLSHLTSLDLSQNNFVGEISSFFGSSNPLTDIDVENNILHGNFPLKLLNSTTLSYISLTGNQFSGMLPPNIGSLSNLEFFYVSHNAFTGPISSSLFTIPSLGYIDLSNNQLNGTLELGNISESSKIEDLFLGDNNFMGSIPRSISKLVNLGSLDLSHLNTQGSVVDLSIFSKSLYSLSLSHLNTTTTLDLNAVLPYFKSLDTLDLSGNHVSTENSSLVVSDPPVLRELNLSGCGIIEFPELLRTQHNMRRLDISNNRIKGQVPGWLWELPFLEYVSLSNNTLTGFQTPTKHNLSYVRNTSLSYLFGANNNFTGKIPSFICELRSLTTLDLSNNKLSGSFPSCLGNFSTTLEVLNLRQNHLSGGIPENMSQSLISLDIGHNRLVGTLPRSFIRITSLQVLNVESNKISDVFPFWLSSLPELQVLVLRSNAFHGPVVIHQTPFSKLRIIDINHNHFNGTLPSDLFVNWMAMYSIEKNEDRHAEEYMGISYYSDSVVMVDKGVERYLERILKIFTAVDFSGNKFEGEIPRSIDLLKELHVLNFSNNAFTGHIPSSLGNLTALESLDVSRNNLSGQIPQELGNLSFLSYMNFSHNQLVGLVPGGTQFMTQPCSSFEDNPGLYGPSLDEVCGCFHATTCQRSEMPNPEEDEDEDEEEVLSWIAAAIGFVPGVFFGLTMGYILVSYKPERFTKAFVPNKRRHHNSLKRRRI